MSTGPGYRPSGEPRSAPPLGISASSSAGEPRAHSRRWYDPFRRVWGSRPLVEQVPVQHHVGGAYNATNHNHGHATTIQHASNITMVNHGASDDLFLLESLPRHPDISAEWREVVPNSRDTDLRGVWKYIDSPVDKELIFWIHGPPGVGKSSLARVLRDDLRARNRLAASLFFSRLPAEWGPETAIRLIGGEIGRTHRKAAPIVAEATRQSHGASLSLQVDKFIRDPLLSLQLPHPLIIVIDGITEWKPHVHFIEQLTRLAPHTSLVRFVILGQSELPGEHRNGISIRSYALSPVSVETMAGYLNKRFSTIKWREGRRPTLQDVLRLAALADGNFAQMEEVVSIIRDLPPSIYDDISTPIADMGFSRLSSCQKSGLTNEIKRSILLNRVALALRPSGHPERQHSLNNLGVSLGGRYLKSNSAQDLEEAILLHREALTLRPPGHPDRHYSFYNLASLLHDRFLKDGLVGDLEEATTLGREALSLRPEGHERRFTTVYDQQMYHYDRFKIKGAVEDLQEAITLAEEAARIRPMDSSRGANLPERISLYKADLARVVAGQENLDK